jgi:hypothetical protein
VLLLRRLINKLQPGNVVFLPNPKTDKNERCNNSGYANCFRDFPPFNSPHATASGNILLNHTAKTTIRLGSNAVASAVSPGCLLY